MTWQDFVLSAGTFVFAAALIPSIRGKHKPHLSTSLMTGLMIMVFVATYITLDLLVTAAVAFVNGLLWLVLAYQKFTQDRQQ